MSKSGKNLCFTKKNYEIYREQGVAPIEAIKEQTYEVKTNKNTKVYYRVNEQIFQYSVVENGSIKKQDLDKLLGEENRMYILNDNYDSYYYIKCDFMGEI